MSLPEWIIKPPISVELQEKLRTKRVMIGTPMAGGMAYQNYIGSMIDFAGMAAKIGMTIERGYIGNESLVQRGRNRITNQMLLADQALDSQCTHLMFIDADIGFKPIDIFSLLLTEKPIIGAVYPKKILNTKKIVEAAAQGVPYDKLEHCSGEFVFRPKNGQTPIKVLEPAEVLYLGTGFLLIERSVLEGMRNIVPNYLTNHYSTKVERHSAFFHCDVVNDEYLSEDYWFCYKAAEAGHSLWMAPWVYLTHMGTTEYCGCFWCSQGRFIHKGIKPERQWPEGFEE